MKEFIEQLKLYKEYIIMIVVIVSGCLFVINYFATKEALTTTRKSLSLLIDQRECWLKNRIMTVDMSASIANLERERLEKTRAKIELAFKSPASLSHVDRMYKQEQLEQISKDFQRIDEELKAYRNRSREASEKLSEGTCLKLTEERP